MNESRTAILSAVRRSLIRDKPTSSASFASLETKYPKRHVPIEIASNHDLMTKFCRKHEAVKGTYEVISKSPDLLGALENYLDRHDLAFELVCGKGPTIDNIAWPYDWKVHKRFAQKRDRTVISEAFSAIAETGSLVFVESKESVTSDLFLSDDHIVLLDRANILESQEHLWARLRCSYSQWPKSVNLITGPSKTADVEQTIEYGAHGPRRLHVIVYNLNS